MGTEVATSPTCAVKECFGGGKIRKGLCCKHYMKLLRRGDPC